MGEKELTIDGERWHGRDAFVFSPPKALEELLGTAFERLRDRFDFASGSTLTSTHLSLVIAVGDARDLVRSVESSSLAIETAILVDVEAPAYDVITTAAAEVLVFSRRDRLRLIDAIERSLDEEPPIDDLVTFNLIGDSPILTDLKRIITRVAPHPVPVMLLGETGTGKELVARALHYGSERRDAPFIPVNCGALSDDLFASELFGHERGAFTDAKTRREGLVAQAADGTLFLDEVDSLTPRAQAMLLRFLQEREYRPLGSAVAYTAEARIISASNRPIESLIEERAFREDLYYRLKVFEVRVPALRERTGDVERLTNHFLTALAARYGMGEKEVHPNTMRWMVDYTWPGNVRELENYLHRIYILSRGHVIHVPAVMGDPGPVGSRLRKPPARAGRQDFQSAKRAAIDEFERAYIEEVLAETGGNVSAAARLAGAERRAFTRIMAKHQIHRDRFHGGST